MPTGLKVADNLDEVVATIVQIGLTLTPNEAGGVIVPTMDMEPALWVIPLENISQSPTDSFLTDLSVSEERIKLRLEECHEPTDVWLWHTHPGGNVGPSRLDIQHRVEGVQYLVVALPGGEAVRY